MTKDQQHHVNALRRARERHHVSTPTADAQALDAIAHLLRDPDWTVGMLEDITDLVESTGRDLTEYADFPPTWDRH